MSDPASTTTMGCCSPADDTAEDAAPTPTAEAPTAEAVAQQTPEAAAKTEPVATPFGRCC